MSDKSVLLKPCPHCRKSIPVGMTVCPYCHRDEKGQETGASEVSLSTSLDAAIQNDLNQLAGEDPYARQEAAERLYRRGVEVVPHLLNVLNEHSRKGLPDVAKILGRLRDRRAIGMLAQAMKIGDEDLRTAAVWALCQMNDPQVMPDLLQEAERPNPTVQGYIAHALAGFQDPRVVPSLSKLCGHSSQEVVFQALWSLGEVGDVAAIPILSRNRNRKEPLVAMVAAAALRRLGASGHRPLSTAAYAVCLLAAFVGVFVWFWHFYR